MAGLDLLARKSLEHGSEASILLSSSSVGSTESRHQDHWSWRHLSEQFCIKNAESLFEKYQSRLQHAMLILALFANVVSGILAIVILCCFSNSSVESIKVPLAIRAAATLINFTLFIISCKEKWFFSSHSRIIVSFFVLILTVAAETTSSVQRVANGYPAGPRFSAYSLLISTIFLPFPKWYQVGLASVLVTTFELIINIVNSVALTASLHGNELVETLNELFGRFDDRAEKNSCLRIKLLGDCYYCVSGLPDDDPRHADHCVQMALDMIDIIRKFREETRVNVDMRIGVHSGKVLSGLLGLRKWQFDIWSRDVTIASRMEQTGRPGCVHISKATKDLLKGEYNIEPHNGNIRDSYLSKLDLETFFILPSKKQPVKESLYIPAHLEKSPAHGRRVSSINHEKIQRRQSNAVEVLTSRRRTVLGFSLLHFHQMVSQVNESMEDAIDAMALSKKDQWFNPEGIQPLLLTFLDISLEMPFLRRKDPLFKYSLLAVLFSCFALTTIGALLKPSSNLFWIPSSITFLVVIVSILLSWLPVIWKIIKKSAKLPVVSMLKGASNSFLLRTAVVILLAVLLMTTSLMGMEDCNRPLVSPFQENITIPVEMAISCENPWYFTWCAILSMISVSVFLRIHFFIKLLINGSLVAAFSGVIYSKSNLFYKTYLQDWNRMPDGVDQYWCLLVTLFLLHLLDRQVEYIGRLDYLWKRKLKKEQEEATTMGLVNRTLLQNILPVHVAILSHKWGHLNGELNRTISFYLLLDLYHEEYSSVAVMFASIPNYMDYYSESLLNDEGRKCLQVLHEIICEFDVNF
ncbi:Adenylate cyclase type 2 like protein [Argiope bruennichi]|uniref:adenylate cyclase n=1 Tax=Argiope bruennichi TaxID=94029 RepID=A0A8T0EM83_ARGBR|nr:Adenylate cyclase type 2 like protein [Argiope bruennichi]